MQNMMHVTPMWIPMMMPVVEVLLFCSSFMQSQGGFSTARKRRGGQWCYSSIAPLVFGDLKSEPWAVLGAVYGKRSRGFLPAYAPPLLPASQEGRHSKHRTGISVVSQPHYLATAIRYN